MSDSVSVTAPVSAPEPVAPSSSVAAVDSTSTVPPTPTVVIPSFTLWYESPGGCFQYDRFRSGDVYDFGFMAKLRPLGVECTRNHSHHAFPRLFVTPAGSSTRYKVWEYDPGPSHTGPIYAYPWDSMGQVLADWAVSGVPPSTAQVV